MNKKKDGKRSKWVLLLSIITVIYMCVYLVWRAVFTIPGYKEYGWVAFIAGIFLLIAEVISALEAFIHYKDMNTDSTVEMPVIPDEWYPDVDVFIATHNESEAILFKTVNACNYMKYPDKNKVHIHICDDGNRENIKQLADRMGVNWIGLADNKDAKAGNLNNALKQTKSPLIVTFDADMIPSNDFLMETVPYFFLPIMEKNSEGVWVEKSEEEKEKAKKIGFIQTPQTFYNPDLFQYNLFTENDIPNEQDYFFRRINVGKNKSSSPIYAGSNTVISREALEEVGGIRTGTITEDFETGLLIEMKGYLCYAVDKLLAKGLAPESVKQLIQQRERWARGCIFSLRRVHILLNPKIPFRLKVSYYMCRMYWGSFTRRAVYMLAPLLFMLLGIPVVICSAKEILIFWLPAYILYNWSLRLSSGSIRNSRWSNIIDTILFPYLLLPIWQENLGIHKREFAVTNKDKSVQQDDDRYLAIPYIVLLIFTVIAFIMALYEVIAKQYMGTVVVAYWLFVNIGSLIMATFFMLGRRNERSSERWTIEAQVVLSYNDKEYQGVSTDISEGGLAVTLKEAAYLPYDEDDMTIRITDRDYDVEVKGRVVSVIEQDRRWKYCIKLAEMDEEAERVYMQIIYDRVHTLPKEISARSSTMGDLITNLRKRGQGVHAMHRRTARLRVGESFKTKQKEDVFVKDFNFDYISLEAKENAEFSYEIIIAKDAVLKCHKDDTKEGLYAIDNIDELMENEAFLQAVSKWDEEENEGNEEDKEETL